MSKRIDRTSIGGSGESFATTHWSTIFNARTSDEVRRNTLMDSLLRKYWKPVYCSIRRSGCDNEQAKDLTQGFFHEIVLDSNLIRQADRTKGRFRTFLLTALDHYLIDAHRKDKARKRAPRGQIFRLDSADAPDLPAAGGGMRPDQVFNYVWATEIIDEVIVQVEDECRSTGKEKHWRVFCAKVLVPIIENKADPSLSELCERYGIEDEARASNMMITVKRCFRRALEGQLRHYVRTDADIEDEIRELFEIIAVGGAG